MADYWGERHEKLCTEWLRVSNNASKIRIYEKLKPSLYLMFANITRRYFSVPGHQVEPLFNDCLSHIFIKIDKYNPEANVKFYSYIGTIIRNWLHDKLVRMVNNNDTLVDYHDDLGSVSNYNNNEIEYVYDTPEIDFGRLISRLKVFRDILTLKLKVKQKMASQIEYIALCDYHKLDTNIGAINTKAIEDEIRIIDLMLEYVDSYEDFTTASVFEYVINKTGMDKFSVYRHLKLMFNLSVMPSLDAYTSEKYDIIDDDLCPNEKHNKSHLRDRRHKLKPDNFFI